MLSSHWYRVVLFFMLLGVFFLVEFSRSDCTESNGDIGFAASVSSINFPLTRFSVLAASNYSGGIAKIVDNNITIVNPPKKLETNFGPIFTSTENPEVIAVCSATKILIVNISDSTIIQFIPLPDLCSSLDYIGDLNGDTIMDFAVTATDLVFLVLSTFTNQFVTIQLYDLARKIGMPIGIGSTVNGVGDLNNDGVPDLIVTDASGAAVIYYMDSTAFPTSVYFLSSDVTSCVAIGDIDYDTLPDLACAVMTGNTIGYYTFTSSNSTPESLYTRTFVAVPCAPSVPLSSRSILEEKISSDMRWKSAQDKSSNLYIGMPRDGKLYVVRLMNAQSLVSSNVTASCLGRAERLTTKNSRGTTYQYCNLISGELTCVVPTNLTLSSEETDVNFSGLLVIAANASLQMAVTGSGENFNASHLNLARRNSKCFKPSGTLVVDLTAYKFVAGHSLNLTLLTYNCLEVKANLDPLSAKGRMASRDLENITSDGVIDYFYFNSVDVVVANDTLSEGGCEAVSSSVVYGDSNLSVLVSVDNKCEGDGEGSSKLVVIVVGVLGGVIVSVIAIIIIILVVLMTLRIKSKRDRESSGAISL